MAERCPDPAVQQRVDVDLALIDSDDRWLSDVEWPIVQTATQSHAQTLYRRPSVPGSGKILRLVLRYEIHALARFPRVQEVVSYGRRITGAKESAGTRDGPSGAKSGHASLKWAFSAAAGLFLRHNPAGQQELPRVEKHHGQGQAFTIWAHKWARAVYDMLKRDTGVNMQTFLNE